MAQFEEREVFPELCARSVLANKTKQSKYSRIIYFNTLNVPKSWFRPSCKLHSCVDHVLTERKSTFLAWTREWLRRDSALWMKKNSLSTFRWFRRMMSTIASLCLWMISILHLAGCISSHFQSECPYLTHIHCILPPLTISEPGCSKFV